MRTLCLSVALGLALSLLPAQLPAQVPSEKDVERWRADLQSQEERLRRQAWKGVAKDARQLVREMVDGLLSGQPSATILAHALMQQAVAEAGLGHQVEAVWLWHLAQNLDARYREVPLGSYGPAGVELEGFRLRQAGTAPAAWPTLPAEGSFQPPRVLRQGASYTPEALARFLIAGDIEVEMVVGPDGRVLEPVLLTEPEFPTLAFVLLDSLREWRFEPARVSGEAVPALFRARISHGRLQKLQKGAEASSSNRHRVKSWEAAEKRLAEFDERLRKGEGQAIQAAVLELVSELRQSGPENGLLAEGLRTLALAEARSSRREEAVWHWQVAQNLQPNLELDAAAYGEAGALLARHKLRRRDEAPAGLEVVAAADLGAGATSPRKIAGDEPVIPDSPRASRWTRLQAVIDTEGRVVEPLVLAGRSDAMRWAALETVRTWRFEPARREGKPVAVLLDIQLPPRAETPLAEMMPFTGELGNIHVLILRQDWENARTRAAAAVQSVAEESLADPRRQAAALALLALADAGSGGSSSICYWHAAQALYGDLYHAELDVYGAAGALLEASNPWVLDEKILRVGMTSEGETVVRPEKIKGGSVPQYATKDRRAGVQGVIIIDSIIGEDGRISQLRLLQGLAPATDFLALSAICEWRFNPATAGGKPVKVYYVLTVNYRVSS